MGREELRSLGMLEEQPVIVQQAVQEVIQPQYVREIVQQPVVREVIQAAPTTATVVQAPTAYSVGLPAPATMVQSVVGLPGSTVVQQPQVVGLAAPTMIR